MALDLRSSEIEHNFIKERISRAEKHFIDIGSKLSSYIKKLTSLGDCGNEIAKSILNFSSKENYNQTLRLTLGNFSDVLLSIQEYREAEVRRTKVKVIDGLESCRQLCPNANSEIKKCFDARVKELKKKNNLEKARSKNQPNWHKIAQAEKEVNQAQEEAARMTQAMGKLVETFERKKLEDLKHIFLEFVKIEMIFHAKAIELYTRSYNILKEINVEDDLHEFTSHFKAHTSTLDVEALSPIIHDTLPKMIDANTESSAYISHKPKAISGVQGTPRSVFTLKATVANTVNENSSSKSFIESKYESRD